MSCKPKASLKHCIWLGMGLVMCGCQTTQSYPDGHRVFGSNSQPASGSYAQSGSPYGQAPRNVSVPTAANLALNMKPEMAATGAAIPVEVSTSLHPVSTNGLPSQPTPMMTITVPAVKFLVPITGSYASGPNGPVHDSGVSQLTLQLASPPGSADGQMHRNMAGTPTIPMINTAPKMIAPPMAPQSGVPSTSVQYLPSSLPLPSDDSAKPSVLAPPPPSWPKAANELEENTLGDLQVPPPPPVTRNSSSK